VATTPQTSGAKRATIGASDRLGAVFSGWRLDAVLGESTTNTVYSVTDRLGQTAALRLMHVESRSDTGTRRRAFREAATIRTLSHAGTAAILLADITTTGEPYVVMERLVGLDSAKLLAALGTGVDVRVALAIVVQVLDVLQIAHQRGITHRNVQPVTVFACRGGDVRLLDFGGALLPTDAGDQSLAGLGLVVGAYTAPELRAGQALGDARSDVFGVGVVLLTLLVGPDAAKPDDALAVEGLYGQALSRLERLPLMIRDDIAALLQRSCSWSPEARFATAGAMRDAAAALLQRMELADAAAYQAVVAGVVAEHVGADVADVANRAFLAYDLLRSIFERIERTLYQARRTHWDDPETESRVAEVLASILEAVRRDAEGITFQIRPHGLELLGRPVWEPRHPFDAIPYRLFDSGFRKIRLLPTLENDECRRFLRWLVTDPEADLGLEDDLATLFWRQAFESVRCDLVSSVVLQDLDEYDVLDRELQAIQSEAVRELQSVVNTRFRGEATVEDATLLAPDGDELLASKSRLTSGLLSAASTAMLREGLHSNSAQTQIRLAELLVRTHEAEVTPSLSPIPAAFQHFVHESLESDSPLGAASVFASIRRQLARRELLAPLAAAFQNHAAMRRVLESAVTPSGASSEPSQSRAIAASLHAILETSGPEVYDAVGVTLARCSDDLLIAVFERYVGRYSSGRAGNLQASIPEATIPAAVAILRAIWILPDEGSVETTRAALRNPSVDVRLDAFARLVAGAPRVALDEFAHLLVDEDTNVRRTSMRIAVKGQLRGAFDTLQRRAKSDVFDSLTYAERQQILVSMLDLEQQKGEDTLGLLLLEEGAFSSHERDQTRILIAEILAERGTQESTLRTVRTLTGVRFWTSKPVREAARAAADKLEARLQGRAVRR
jgi:serine/threonine protein kinase